MTKKQRIALWRKVSQCFERHEREMIEQQKKEENVDRELSDYEKKYGHDGTEANNMALFEGLRHQPKQTISRELSDYEKKYGQDGTVANNMAMASIMRERIRQQQEAEPWLFRHEGAAELKGSVKQYADPLDPTFSEEPNGRWNWYGEAEEEDATSMDDDLPSAAEDCAKQRGNYEI